MARNSAAGLLTSVDSMFTTQEERDNAQRSYVTDLPAAEISDFPNHPFKVRMDESMMELAESVKERGVLSPVLVRPMPDGSYQMVAGHRRKRAAELAELPTVPCIVRELTDDEATTVTADYAGTVSRISLNKIRYVAIFEGTALEPITPEEPGNTSDPSLTDPTAPVDPTDPTGQDAPTGEKNNVLPVVAVVAVVLLGGGAFYFIKRRR